MKVNNKINKRILLLLALYFKSTSAAPNLAVVDEWWSVDQQVLLKELGMDEVRLKLLDVDHIQIRHTNQTDSKNLHSCYDIRYGGNTKIHRVCYPRIVITGEPKAGTSALFALLEQHPNSFFLSSGKKIAC